VSADTSRKAARDSENGGHLAARKTVMMRGPAFTPAFS
jgi:hypothetical protein